MFIRALTVVAVAASLAISTSAFAESEDGEDNLIVTASESSGPAVAFRSAELGGPVTQYTSDSMGGIMASFGEGRFAIHPQVGFAKDGFGFDGAAAACALGVGSPRIGYFSYQPRFLVGSQNDGLALGMRNALAWHSAHDLFTMEIGHQFLDTNDGLTMDVRAAVGFNAGGLLDIFM